MKQVLFNNLCEILLKQKGKQSWKSILTGLTVNLEESDLIMLIERAEGLMKYDNFLCEDEAMQILKGFINFDGTSGAHWKDPQAMFNAVESAGYDYDVEGEYNKWAWFATMNMIWGDEWGVLKTYLASEHEVKIIAELTKERLEDPDGIFNVRQYFNV